MNVDGDVAFFYQLYGKLYRLVGQEARCFDSHKILPFLLYVENTIAVGIDGVYEYRYRSVGNVESRWCIGFDMSATADSEVHNLVGKAVAEAKYSALRQWTTESVLSGDFSRLSEMLTWFAREDKILRLVYPDLRYRKELFIRLTGNRQTARRMLWADLAFNWRDKRGDSLMKTIAKHFRYETSFVEAEEKGRLKEAAEILLSPETPCGCMVVLAAVNISEDEKEIIATVRDLRLATKTMFADRFRRAIQEGQIPADTDVPALAGALNTLLEGLSLQARDGLFQSELKAIAAHAVRMLPPRSPNS